MAEVIEITPVTRPIHGTVAPPGSKSLTNRAMIVAALADGTSRLSKMLESRDTEVMRESLAKLGISVDYDPERHSATVTGCAGKLSAENADLWLENSGTSIRFLSALCATRQGIFRLDGNDRMRQRPIGDLGDALSALGVGVTYEKEPGFPPIELESQGLTGGQIEVAGYISSQYLSALLMAAPCARSAVEITVRGELVSVPYVEMTLGVMQSFGVAVERSGNAGFRIEPQTYQATDYTIEPDASAASYFFAAAAITGGEVTIRGLSRRSLQGDVDFVDVLEQMGCRVEWKEDSITVHGGDLRGLTVDMNAISDTAQTLAAVAVYADGPTHITNIAHVRHKETDRIHAVVTELRRLGIIAEEHDDGITIHPGPVTPATIATYDDHRMAMSFALVGLKSPGICIADPECTGKTYPNFFDDLDKLCERSR